MVAHERHVGNVFVCVRLSVSDSVLLSSIWERGRETDRETETERETREIETDTEADRLTGIQRHTHCDMLWSFEIRCNEGRAMILFHFASHYFFSVYFLPCHSLYKSFCDVWEEIARVFTGEVHNFVYQYISPVISWQTDRQIDRKKERTYIS